jgi:hypothetical protein
MASNGPLTLFVLRYIFQRFLIYFRKSNSFEFTIELFWNKNKIITKKWWSFFFWYLLVRLDSSWDFPTQNIQCFILSYYYFVFFIIVLSIFFLFYFLAAIFSYFILKWQLFFSILIICRNFLLFFWKRFSEK